MTRVSGQKHSRHLLLRHDIDHITTASVSSHRLTMTAPLPRRQEATGHAAPQAPPQQHPGVAGSPSTQCPWSMSLANYPGSSINFRPAALQDALPPYGAGVAFSTAPAVGGAPAAPAMLPPNLSPAVPTGSRAPLVDIQGHKRTQEQAHGMSLEEQQRQEVGKPSRVSPSRNRRSSRSTPTARSTRVSSSSPTKLVPKASAASSSQAPDVADTPWYQVPLQSGGHPPFQVT
jgi:hypothetical protein